MQASLCRAFRPTALLACAAVAGPLAGCGSSPTPGKGFDPARAVPASAPLFVGAIVRPTGALSARALAAGKTLTHQANPYLRLLGALQTPGSPPLDYKRDLAPWLGAQAGAFLSSAAGAGRTNLAPLLSLVQQGILGGPAQAAFPFATTPGPPGAPAAEGAFVLDVTDTHAARSFLDAQARRAGAQAKSYRGVAYEASAAGVAFGLVGRFAVIGTEAALRSVIETAAGGPALARAPAYASLLAAAPAEALAHAYLSGGAPVGSGARGGSPELLALLTGSRPANVSLLPSASALTLVADTLPAAAAGAPGGLLSPQRDAARAVGELPSESYLALGFGSGSSALSQDMQALRGLFSLPATRPGAELQAPGLSVKGLLAAALAPVALMTESGAQARRDFQSWMGPGALFASGSGLVDLKAGLVISSTNPALSRTAVAKLAVKLRASGAALQPASIPGTDAALTVRLNGLPVALYIADGRDAKGQTKFVIGLGEASVAAVLGPSSTLSTAGSYGAASMGLGEGIQPSLIVALPTLLSLLESAGLSEDPSISPLLPYLRTLTTVSGGSRALGGGIERLRLVLELRPA
jgi:hypothetical protein